jgi:uncharacterized coiled-coil DUF342 family protein
VAESDELAFVRGERDRYRAQLREIEAERDRLRADVRGLLSQVEHWRTLAEYREAMLDEQRERSKQPRCFLDGLPS